MGGARAFLTIVSMVAVALAGCADDAPEAPEEEVVTQETHTLQQGTGAIAGLLVDDRFRPIDLEDNPTTEFQAKGFILVQETGQQITTNENGEFSLVDIEPGVYTLRLSAEGVEAAPEKVQVAEGVFNEAQMIARRAVSTDDVIITQEHAAFASCFVNFVILSYTLDCTGDRSGDTDRAAWYPDLVELNGSLEYVVVEVLFDNHAPATTAYDMVARANAIGTDYSAFLLEDDDGRYGKMHLPVGRVSPDEIVSGGGCDDSPDGPDGFCPYYPDKALQIIMFGRGFFYQEVKDGYAPVQGALASGPCVPGGFTQCLSDYTNRRGAGGALGTQATYMLSAFLYDPEAEGDLLHETDYCVLCDPGN